MLSGARPRMCGGASWWHESLFRLCAAMACSGVLRRASAALLGERPLESSCCRTAALGGAPLRPRSLAVIDMQETHAQPEHDSSKLLDTEAKLVCLALAARPLAYSIDSCPRLEGCGEASLHVSATRAPAKSCCLMPLQGLLHRVCASSDGSNRIPAIPDSCTSARHRRVHR